MRKLRVRKIKQIVLYYPYDKLYLGLSEAQVLEVSIKAYHVSF